ncbi:carboxy-S-adenosyl-L-methionine synthase CmoA [Methylocaldum sp.]|uniref:carboxy-S-adenosyl-L-methionine synthase CmoA n=1 Tax=Methylocaldum sp. TaxID=1969727 RepID=UPI002D6AA11B|nr:carboxy-S-adenosyl-L-methionine synthase CmoA [Methylocaldum sp.]HYE34589.1 carboxy-S-adenosyl-L-methionine synthase CmoA [Methylocaldum sp.]
MTKDDLFKDKRSTVMDFDFGKDTAEVFDDMLDRSVPFYAEIQRMMGEIAGDFAVAGTNLYDLGCSTGTTFIGLDPAVAADVTFIGVDSSPDMLEKARKKLEGCGFSRPYELVCLNLDDGVPILNASVVILNLTLQFIRPLNRDRVISGIAHGLNDSGCLILVEKVLSQDSTINRLFIKHYYEFKKRNGYSELEISQKREALENVLIPYHFDENRELLLRNGFKSCDVFFRWYNFCGMVALK